MFSKTLLSTQKTITMNALLKHVTKQLFISLLLFPVFALSGNGGNYIIVQDVDANAEDIIQVEIHVENTESVIAIEFNFHYPNDVMTFLPGPEYTYLTDRAQNHILNIAPDTEGGSLYIFVIDLGQLAPFTGNSGALLKIGFEINAADTGLSFPLTLSDAILSNEIGEDILDEAIGGQLFILDDETPPEILILDDHIIEDGEEACYDSNETIILSGNDGWFWVQQGGSVTLIAGNNIIMKPGTQVDAGGYLHARIAIDEDDFCGIPVADYKKDNLITGVSKHPQQINTNSVKLFPNPTHGEFTVELLNLDTTSQASIEVYDVYGNLLFREQLGHDAQHQFSLSGKPAGIYFVRISNGDYSEVVRLIKR